MSFEIITVNEYYGNNFCSKRQAKLYENGKLEFIPIPESEETESYSCMKNMTKLINLSET